MKNRTKRLSALVMTAAVTSVAGLTVALGAVGATGSAGAAGAGGKVRPVAHVAPTTPAPSSTPPSTPPAKPASNTPPAKPASNTAPIATATAKPAAKVPSTGDTSSPVETRTPTHPAVPGDPPPQVPEKIATPDPRPAGCDAPADGSYRPATEVEMYETMTRVWLLCEAPSVFGTADAGLELRSDGQWSRLQQGPGHTLVRATSPGSAGSWDILDTGAVNGSPTFQVNFELDNDTFVYATTAFGSYGARGPKMRLDNMRTFLADYVPAPAGTVVLPVLPVPVEDDPCVIDVPDSPGPTTQAGFEAAMTGAWLRCSTTSVFATEEAGFEVRADGRWSKLHWGPGHVLVRSTGPDQEGTWDTLDIGPQNGRPLFQFNLTLDSGWIGTVPELGGYSAATGEAAVVHIHNMGTVSDYVPVPAGTRIR